MKYPVYLNIYDLSNGYFKYISPFCLGLYSPAVWHTSISISDYEIFFGGGIVVIPKNEVANKYKIKKLSTEKMGETELEFIAIRNILFNLSDKYSVDNYDLLTQNCNHFTDELLQILIGQNLPEEYFRLTKQILQSPLREKLVRCFANKFITT